MVYARVTSVRRYDLAAALKFAEEGVGHLIEPPQSTKHVIVRFEENLWRLLRAEPETPAGSTSWLHGIFARDDNWHDELAQKFYANVR